MNNTFTAEMARRVADRIRAEYPDDEDLIAGMVEGETDAGEALDDLLDVEAHARTMIEANKARMNEIKDRNARFALRIDACRSGMLALLDATEMSKWERPEATVSKSRVAPSLIGDSADGLPPEFQRIKVEPDKPAIKNALKDGKAIPGWTLSNGGETVTIRRK